MLIITPSVWSKQVTETEMVDAGLQDRLPAGIRPYRHQLETYRELRNPGQRVVINRAITGDGKSLAAQLCTLVNGVPLLAMYPTNELIRDQMRQVENSLRQWQQNITLRAPVQ